MYIVGGIDDQLPLLMWSRISDSLFAVSNPTFASHEPYTYLLESLLRPAYSNQPLLATFNSIFLTLLGSNSLNMLILLTVCVNFASSWLLFRKFRHWWFYVLVFSFSSYFWIHLGIHNVLSQIWMFPMFLVILQKVEKKFDLKKSVLFGIFIVILALISNYNTYLILVFYTVYMGASVFLRKFQKSRDILKIYLVSIGVFAVGIVFVLFPYVKLNYFSGIKGSNIVIRDYAVRPYEDFFSFSSRPWYFVLPPVKNPIFGDFSKNTLAKIESRGYFLADDYFAGEHQGNYFGATFLIITIISAVYVLKNGAKKEKQRIYLFGLVAFLLFLFTLPPFFTISGLKIYTPGWFLYKFFPMFRVTARLSIVILLSLLMVFGHSMEFIFKNTKKDKKLIMPFMILLLVVTLAETFIPFKVQKLDKAPQVYTYLKLQTPPGTKFAVYPLSLADEALFWLPEHERLLVNPRWYKTHDFDSAEYTKNLSKNVKSSGVSYIIVSKDRLNEIEGENSDNIRFFGEYGLIKVD